MIDNRTAPEVDDRRDELLRQGRLSQRCPACGLVEASGRFCTTCGTSTGLAHSFVNDPQARQEARRRSESGEIPAGRVDGPEAAEARPQDDDREALG